MSLSNQSPHLQLNQDLSILKCQIFLFGLFHFLKKGLLLQHKLIKKFLWEMIFAF